MSRNITATRPVGRPTGEHPKRSAGGKGRLLSANITAATRQALEDEAKLTNRSISQVAEEWIEDGRSGRAHFEKGLRGDVALALAVAKLVAIAQTVQDVLPGDRNMSEALLTAWRVALPRLVPTAPVTAESVRMSLAANEVWEACDAVREAITVAGSGDPVYERANQTLFGSGLVGTTPLFERLAMALVPSWDGYPSANVIAALTELRASGKTARAEIDRALPLAKKFFDEHREALKARERAVGVGLRIGLEGSIPASVLDDDQ